MSDKAHAERMPAAVTALLKILRERRSRRFGLGMKMATGPMEAAVRALVDAKVGTQGIFRGGASQSAWGDPAAVAKASPAPSEANIQAVIAYCEYVYGRYGRFPAYAPPMRTVLGFQVNHLDVEFYDRFYRPEALSEEQREHMKRWHGG